ncbi:unnamed protein product [Linum trigynum]|uniref:Uncharacterized protein n=1 Tax=Linum trigynum TaxID=586398 RepID=A0AAV2CXU8_9ROSI
MSNSDVAAMIDFLFHPHLHRHHHQPPPSPASSAPPPSTATTTSSTAPPPTFATCMQAGSLHQPRRLPPPSAVARTSSASASVRRLHEVALPSPVGGKPSFSAAS